MEPCGQPNGPLSSQIDNDVHFLGWLNMATRPSPGNLLHSSTAILRRNCLVSIHLCVKLMCEVKKSNEVAQSYLTLCNPMDCSLPGCSVHGILQARVLEWGAIAFSNLANICWTGQPQKVCACAQLLHLSPTLCNSMELQEPARLLCPWDYPDKNTGVGYHALPQGIFLTQGANLVSCIGRWILYH